MLFKKVQHSEIFNFPTTQEVGLLPLKVPLSYFTNLPYLRKLNYLLIYFNFLNLFFLYYRESRESREFERRIDFLNN